MKAILSILIMTCASLSSLVAREAVDLKNVVIATISVGSQSSAILARPSGKYVYVANGTNISAIDVSTNTVSFTFPTNVENPSGANGLALSPDEKTLYSTNDGNVVDVDSISKKKITTTYPTGNIPNALAVSPNGTLIYVPNVSDGTVTVISNGTVLNPIAVGGTPTQVVFTPDGTEAYLVSSNVVSVIDTATNTVSTTIPIATIATGIAISPDGSNVYVAANDAIYEIATSSNTVTNSISVTSPNGTNVLAYPSVTPNGRYLYVPNPGQLSNGNLIEGNTVVVLDTATWKLVGAPITVGDVPIMAATTPNGKYAYISNEYDGTVSVIQIN
jgi:YVTN family beta-propeller protein